MYRIGQFSKITKVTIKALRFYEEEGLLEPCFVDAVNGYRYYDSDQLQRMFKIVALKQCGFSIPDIRQIIVGKNLASLFEAKKRELEKQAKETSIQISSINHYLERLGKEVEMKHEIVIKELPRVLVYSLRTVVESYDSYFDLMPRIGESLPLVNPELRCVDDPPYCFIIYHDGEYKDHDIDIEFCEAVTGPGNGKLPEGIIFKTIERVPQAACVLHKGAYATLSEAYSAVYTWIEDNNFIPADYPRESYIDGIWNKKTSDEWLTEIQVPVLPK